jgi:hypothetical protein
MTASPADRDAGAGPAPADAPPARTASNGAAGWPRGLVGDVVAVLPAWLVARVLVVAAYVVAVAVADRLTPGSRPTPLTEGLIAWDGTWYRDIATLGYQGIGDEGLRFFPLFPLLGRGLGVVLLGQEAAALVLVANAASLAFAVLVRRLVLAEGRGPGAADRAVWLTALFPSAFVLVWAYAEAVMLAAAVGAFLALRRGRWWWAAVAGLVAGATRPLGLLLALPAAIEVARRWRGLSGRERVAGAAAVAGPALGTGLYLSWVGVVYGDPWLPFTVQEDLRGESVNLVSRLWDGVRDLAGPERFGDGLHLPFALVFLVLLVATFRRWPVSYGAFAAAVLVASLSAENLNSLERYGLNAFPVVLTLALLTRDPRVDRAVLAVTAGGFVALASLAWLGAYVP